MKEFKAKLQAYAQQTEQQLDCWLPAQPDDRVTEAMRYSLLAGGKRLRAALALEFCAALSGDAMRAMPFACALEMVHAYSLIHDDLPCMDDDDMRRGKPSCHVAFGEATALLAGDGLLTKAFEVLGSAEGMSFSQISRAVLTLAKAAGHQGMIGGQRMDLENEGHEVPIERVKQTNRLKTGELIIAAVTLGCIAADADEQTLHLAQSYADNIGQAFQITDDILDCVGDQNELGKPIGSDSENNKTTYVSVYGIEEARRIAEEKVKAAQQALEQMKLCASADFLRDMAEYILVRTH